ncbi:MAG: hypothetical protein V4436_01420, partial [Patescibacteria group bacterium]
ETHTPAKAGGSWVEKKRPRVRGLSKLRFDLVIEQGLNLRIIRIFFLKIAQIPIEHSVSFVGRFGDADVMAFTSKSELNEPKPSLTPRQTTQIHLARRFSSRGFILGQIHSPKVERVTDSVNVLGWILVVSSCPYISIKRRAILLSVDSLRSANNDVVAFTVFSNMATPAILLH